MLICLLNCYTFYMDLHLSNTYTLLRNVVATYVIQWMLH